MLKLKYLYENYDLARAGLALYDYDEESSDAMMRYFRISSNAIYPFKGANQEVCFLRLSPVEEKPTSHVRAELHLINWLMEQGFPAMKPVAMKNGNFVDTIQTEWGEYNVSCFSKVAGESLEDVPGTLEVISGYGKLLGKMHSLMKKYPGASLHRDYKELLTEIQERLHSLGAAAIVKAEYDEVCRELEDLSVTMEDYGVIHYDFEPDNVFYDASSGQFNVIDYDDAVQCWYALDVVRALDALDEIGSEDNPAEVFLEGYRSETKFSEEQQQSLSVMRRLVHLQEYATILHVLSEPVTAPPDWMLGLMEKLKWKLQILEEEMRKYHVNII